MLRAGWELKKQRPEVMLREILTVIGLRLRWSFALRNEIVLGMGVPGVS